MSSACRRGVAWTVVLGVAALHLLGVGDHLQGLGVQMLGSTFDPLDFVMYVLGVLAAVMLDRVVLPTPSPR